MGGSCFFLVRVVLGGRVVGGISVYFFSGFSCFRLSCEIVVGVRKLIELGGG